MADKHEHEEKHSLQKTAHLDKPNPVVDNGDANSTVPSGSTVHVEWSPENEMIMVEWCDVAQCYKWLNAESHARYSYMHAWFTIPAIVLSTISGTASFAQTSLPAAYQVYSPMAIGAINIFIGILTTVQQYLKISELNEAHRVSAISWDKFARNIRIELAKKPDERMDAGHFLKLNRQEFDRLMETSPMVDAKVIAKFNTTFLGKEGTPERKRFEALKKPDICNTITSADEVRHKWYLNIGKSTDDFDFESRDALTSSLRSKLQEKELELTQSKDAIRRQKDAVARNERTAKELLEAYTLACKPILMYIENFEKEYDRKPIRDEVYDNLKEEVDPDVLLKYLDSSAFTSKGLGMGLGLGLGLGKRTSIGAGSSNADNNV
jgi:hypothetical protein